MSNTVRLHIFNAVLIIGSLITIPRLTTNLDNYTSETMTLSGTHIVKSEYRRRLRMITRTDLVLEMSSGVERKLSSTYSEFWPIFTSPENHGKTLTLYQVRTCEQCVDPDRIEMDGKVVYDQYENKPFWYGLILLTIVVSTFNIYSIRKRGTTTNNPQ